MERADAGLDEGQRPREPRDADGEHQGRDAEHDHREELREADLALGFGRGGRSEAVGDHHGNSCRKKLARDPKPSPTARTTARPGMTQMIPKT